MPICLNSPGNLRSVLANSAERRPNKSPFVLLYAFNGTGKTRLSTAFKDLGKVVDENDEVQSSDTLYFNAFTEDLFSWDNDLENDEHRVLKLNPRSNFFVGLNELEIDNRIRPLLNRYADFDFKINFTFDERTGEITSAKVTFSRKVLHGKGDDVRIEEVDGIKISRAEENIFVWCFFLAILQLALDGAEAYKWVEHVYIDDPISSLDEHHAIVVGNHLVQLYREAQRPIKSVLSTHHALFFNVLYYEVRTHLDGRLRYILKRDRLTDRYLLAEQKGDTPQFYHVAALQDLWLVAQSGQAKTFHFNILRTILEKTALFLGYRHFSQCIKKADDDADGILHQRFVDLLSHGKYSMYEPTEMGDDTREYFLTILNGFLKRHPFNRELLPESAPRHGSIMTESNQIQLGKTLWAIADQLRGAMNADDFRDYMLALLFLRYLSDDYERAAKKELGHDYPDPNAIANGGRSSLSVWYERNRDDVLAFEKQMRLKAHYVIRPEHLWASIAHMARTQDDDLLKHAPEGLRLHRERFVREHVLRSVFGNQSRLRQARQNLPGPEREALHDHHQDRRGSCEDLRRQRHPRRRLRILDRSIRRWLGQKGR